MMEQNDFFNEDKIVQFSDIDDFLINSPHEINQYISLGASSHSSCDVRILSPENRQAFLTFHSYIFTNEKKEIELETVFQNEVTGMGNIKKGCIVRAQMYLHGVRIVFESFLESWHIEKSTVIFKIATPYKMVRYQRRDSFRVQIPGNFDIKVDLQSRHEFLSQLTCLNISGGGVAVLVNASAEMLESDMVYERARIKLPVGKYDEFELQMRVRHQKKIEQKYLSKLMQAKVTPHPWFQVGLQFGRLPPGMEQALIMIVNNLSRNSLDRG